MKFQPKNVAGNEVAGGVDLNPSRCTHKRAVQVLKSYHQVWLAEHPHRAEKWLRERLADGFDIHHVDGDHENDDPRNLVLIDGGDHLMLHNGKTRIWRRAPKEKPPEYIYQGAAAYRLRLEGRCWQCVARTLELDPGACTKRAQYWARASKEVWPVPGVRLGPCQSDYHPRLRDFYRTSTGPVPAMPAQ